MDKGAHFYKCDFQVHTPRDINWYGASAVSKEERIAYSESLVLACRLKGIHAIAVTDHHDFTFFPYIIYVNAITLNIHQHFHIEKLTRSNFGKLPGQRHRVNQLGPQFLR